MKKIYLYVAFALASIGMISCTDILDQDPLDSFTDEAVWNDLALSETYLNAQYMNLMAENMKGTRFAHYTDEVFQKHTYGSENVTQGLLSCDNAGIGWDDTMWDPWYSYYQYISKLNLFLEKIDNVPGDETSRNEQKGQALFLRAWNYHMLYSLFGRVPIVDHTFDLDSSFELQREDMDKVADFIIKDLDEAAALLPIEYSDPNDFGRVTKGAALALKSRVLLYKASPLFGTPSTEKWQAAANAAKAVFDLNKYYLKTVNNSEEYGALFYDVKNPEVIFEKLFDPKYGSGDNNSFLYQAPCGIGNGFQGWGNFNPTQNLVESFLMEDGKTPGNSTKYKYNANDQYRDRDPRLELTVLHHGSFWLNTELQTNFGGENNPTGAEYSRTSYYISKFMKDYKTRGDYDGEALHLWVMYRYGEVLLNYAEALNEYQSAPSQEVFDAIIALRKRAGIEEDDNCGLGALESMNKTDMRKIIQNERRIEMAFEEQRYWDIRRWRIAEDIFKAPLEGLNIQIAGAVTTYHKINVLSATFDVKRYFYPIPYSEVIKNKNMVQNPNW